MSSFDYIWDAINNRCDESESMKRKFKESLQVKNHETCLLMNGYCYMMHDLINFMATNKIEIWPGSKQNMYLEKKQDIEVFNYVYNELVKFKMKSSRIIIIFITNSFCKSEEFISLLQYSKSLNKPMIGLVVEEIDNYDKLKSTVLDGLSYYCEIYKERLIATGYDQYLWISYTFNELIDKIRQITQVKLDDESIVEDNDDDYEDIEDTDDEDENEEINVDEEIRYHLYILHRPFNKSNMESIFSFYKKVEKFVHGKNDEDSDEDENDDDETIKYNDITMLSDFYIDMAKNTSKIFEYKSNDNYKTLEFKLEKMNIENRNDYLGFIQYLDEFIEKKLNEFKKKNERGRRRKFIRMQYGNIVSYIQSKMKIKFNYHPRNEYEDSDCVYSNDEDEYYFIKGGKDDAKNNYILNYTYTSIKEEFEKFNIPLKFLHEFLVKLNNIEFYSGENDCATIRDTTAIIFALFKENNGIERLYKNFASLNKPIFIVKFDDFEISPDLLDFIKQKGLLNGVFDVYKHKEHDYDGYEMKKLFKAISCGSIPFDDEKDSSISNEDEVEDLILKSRLVIFFLTDKYSNTDEFQHHRHIANEHICIPVEDIKSNNQCDFNLDDFLKIDLHKSSKPFIKSELFHRLCYLIGLKLWDSVSASFNNEGVNLIKKDNDKKKYSMNYLGQDLTRAQKYSEDPIIVHSLITRKALTLELWNVTVFFYDFVENGHILIFNKSHIHIFNRNDLTHVKSQFTQAVERIHGNFFDACYNKDTEKLYVLNGINLLLFGRNYNLIKVFGVDPIKHIAYNEANKMIYLHDASTLPMTFVFDKDLKSEKQRARIDCKKSDLRSMKIFENKVFYLTQSSVLVYDEKLEFIRKFAETSATEYRCILFGKNRLKGFILILSNFSLLLYSSKDYTFYDCIRIPILSFSSMFFSYALVNDNLVKCIGSSTVEMMQINFINQFLHKHDYLPQLTVCQVDPYRRHLFVNPYELPCGNIACLECIYKRITSGCHDNKLKCPFETVCKEVHSLNVELKKSHVIENNLKDICQLLSQYEWPKQDDFLKNGRDLINSHFEMIENMLDIRFESIKNDFDELHKKSLNQLNKLKRKLINKAKKGLASNETSCDIP